MLLIHSTPKPSFTIRHQRSLVRRFRHACVTVALLSATGCLDRPAGPSKPITTNVVVQKSANTAITAIDLLLMIDNSSSMADKQSTLATAVPQLLQQLVQPQCLDANGEPFDPPLSARIGTAKPCEKGSLEFNPVNDIHIGIVTSSLGDHGGGTLCTEGASSSWGGKQPPDVNDMGHLVGTLQRGIDALTQDTKLQQTDNVRLSQQGFLAWGSDQQPHPNSDELTTATRALGDMVIATAEQGCGFEAQLESWFRFLVDPVPPAFPLQGYDAQGYTHRQGVDDVLLAQRKEFLRPNSLVAIVMLTDENDCSLRDTDWGWVGTKDGSVSTGSAACADNPNDPCCYSCMLFAPPKGCAWTCPQPPRSDTQPAGLHDSPRQLNVRCWQQKRRFGADFTYPISRYTVALTKKELCPDQTFGDMDCDCTQAKSVNVACDPGKRRLPNPIYSTIVGQTSDGNSVVGYPDRIARTDNSAVFLAGIVGVPWQDISEPDSQPPGQPLRYIPVTDNRWTEDGGIWQRIYADYNDHGKLPSDPRMVESILPRPGLPPPTAGANADSIIGHEFNTRLSDLEYACIYRLPQPKVCVCDASDAACAAKHPNDCCSLRYDADDEGNANSGGSSNKPLCQDPATGSYDARTQFFAKGYPGLRELAVLRDYATSSGTDIVSGNSIVASICPKDLESSGDSAGYGYNPAVAALLSRLKVALKGSCLPRPLSPDSNGRVLCNVVEVVTNSAIKPESCTTFCRRMGRNQEGDLGNPTGEASGNVTQAVLEQMQKAKLCGAGENSPACSDMCLCLLSQESNSVNTTGSPEGSDLSACQNVMDGTESSLPPGYCYVDPGLLDSSGNPIAGSNPNLVASCSATQKRILRFVGNDPSGSGSGWHVPVPLPNAFVFTACEGSALLEQQ